MIDHTNTIHNLLLIACTAMVTGFFLGASGCAAWFERSPELDYWKCVQATGSYVKCQHLEVVK